MADASIQQRVYHLLLYAAWGGYQDIKIIEYEDDDCLKVKANTKKGYIEAKDGDFLSTIQPNSTTRRGRVQSQVSATLMTGGAGGGIIEKDSMKYRIRKLTPRECFRLQGVKNEDYEKIAKHQSDSSLYHLAGDSITTTVLMAIFGELLDIDYWTKIQEVEADISREQRENGLHRILDEENETGTADRN